MDTRQSGTHVSSDRAQAVVEFNTPETAEAPWKHIYKDVHVLETAHGCIVKVGNALTFVPGATVMSFPLST